MIKKILLGLFFLIAAIVAAVVGYIFHVHAERPATQPSATSVVIDAEYQEESLAAAASLESLYAQYLLPSVSAAVGVNGQLVWQGVIGYADLNNLIPAGTDTQYRIGSISKSMTAVVALRLQEEELVNIDQTFSHYVKDFPAIHEQITLKQLLSHQAGIRHYINDIAENFNSTEYVNTRAAAAIVEQDALRFPPGQGFQYSTYGYTLLSLAMEQAAGQSFENIMNEELFSFLGLGSTHLNNVNLAASSERSVPYLEINNALYKSPEPNVSNKYAGGGFLSSPTDLVKFANALMDDSLLSDASRDLLWTAVPLESGQMNPENYALGFRVGSNEMGKFVHHGGKSVGGYSFLLIYPDRKLVVAFAINSTPDGNPFDRLAEAQKIAQFFSVK